MEMETISLAGRDFKILYPDLLRPLTDTERTSLRASIVERGIVVPVVLDESKGIIDGRNRLEIAAELELTDIPFEIRPGLTAEEKLNLAATLNKDRRQLNNEDRKELAKQMRMDGKSYREIGERLGVDEKTARNDLSGAELSAPETVIGRDGKTYPSRKVRAESPAEVEKATNLLEELEDVPEEAADVEDLARAHRQETREQRREELNERAIQNTELKGTFPVLYADPPWRYEFEETDNRVVENQYPTMTVAEISALPALGKIPAADDAVLFLWVTSPKLLEGIQVMEAWGFEYRTCMVWVKDKIGMGYYARQKHELLLIGKRGSLPVPAENDRPESVIVAPRGKHSAKPKEFYEVIERMYPRLGKHEIFQRGKARPGWSGSGNESNEGS